MSGERTQYEVAPVLEALGFEDVPRATSGHRKVKCAFHGDRNPSASVSRYGFRCWSCGVSGDAIKLLREFEGLSYADAVKRAEAITGGGDTSGGNKPPGKSWTDLLG